ncbi:hypothetical protein BDV37DRAFT_286265 [Aspergillus pseudonomiae]|uniref:Zn(2)-C6 fungal-type domain-containing protein n=1 Tax=Aspergillus pseudonomiae TaxID=1506151 RepID=A0A5N7D3F5_9EURO|nr:uncharacterized protein BDV37DRAFT_286265 [Aspergillus pseudonomiae]KAE8400769.1 hypothetical protein BDV37DRAFT_286265 [Aspergillus pseudonomiae]
MSTTTAKRKRARKACIPCHQRKRKCDNVYPCGMCTTYRYNCSYAENNTSGSMDGGVHIPPPAKRVSLDGTSRLSRTHMRRAHHYGDDSLAKSPTVVAGASPGIFDELKFRYAGASASMAFPHILGVALGSDNPPKMRSFAYNFGIRPEEASGAHCFLGSLISEEDLSFFSDAFFSVLGPIMDVMDPRIYTQRCRDYYRSSGSNNAAFAAVAAGIAALGSFLSPNGHPRESDLVQYAKAILDDPASMRLHDIDHIVAWGMRVLYLRATTRPSNAWIASCTQMHLCEAIGLHEEENIKKIASIAGAAVVGHDADRLRRIFWISWAGHNMLSYEYDRSPVGFRAVTCQSIISIPGCVADQFVQLIQIIPSPNSPFQLELRPPNPSEELLERLKALNEPQFTHPFLLVTKADIAFCFYRRLYQLKTRIPDDLIKFVIDSGNAAVEAAEQQASQGRLFWNVIGSVFQYTCILLAIDTPVATTHIGTALKGLENLVKAADTALTREALSIARHLLSLRMAKKRKELAQLEAIEAGYEFFQTPSASEANTAVPDMDWEVEWDQFFIEPYISMLAIQTFSTINPTTMPKYAKDQSVDFKNTIERVAIVGAGGTIGWHIANALLQTGRHTVTALTRKGSGNRLPEGVLVASIDYNDEASMVAALNGQQFLIITMAPTAPRDSHSKLVQAAAKAGIPYIMPNGYGGDIGNTKLGEDTMLGPVAKANRDEIERLGMQWITVCCGFWYDYSLAGGDSRFGFDFDKRSLTIYDDGNTKNSTSTLSQVGRAVAKVLSLNELPQDENDNSLTLSTFLNQGVYITSFVVSQNDMFESVKRVTGTTDGDWTITHVDTKKRYEDGLAQVKVGNMAGFSKMLYARAFYPDDPSDLSAKGQNELLGLPEENLDASTKVGIDLVKELQLRVERMAA